MSGDLDAVLVISFGGPEQPEDVLPFLENVTRGRGIPRERLLAVAEHYLHFGGKSPINDQNRELIGALRQLMDREGPHLPIYWGNRNWKPFLADTVRQMKDDGVRNASAFITSGFGSYSGCRQYLDDIAKARTEVGSDAPEIQPAILFFDQPGFLGPMTENVRRAVASFETPPHVAFTAHSIPQSMASTSPYVAQLESACRTIAGSVGLTNWKLVYQSRSGPPSQPWLEPDILDHMRSLHEAGVCELVIAPVGFISDHMEVLWDLDTEAADLAKELGMTMVRAATVGTHPDFVRMVRDLISTERHCAANCCPRPQRPAPAAANQEIQADIRSVL